MQKNLKLNGFLRFKLFTLKIHNAAKVISSEKTSWEQVIIKKLHNELLEEQTRYSGVMQRKNAQNQILR